LTITPLYGTMLPMKRNRQPTSHTHKWGNTMTTEHTTIDRDDEYTRCHIPGATDDTDVEHAYNNDERRNAMNANTVISLKEYMELHSMPHNYAAARRAARKGNVPHVTKILGTWAIDAHAPLDDVAQALDAIGTGTRTRDDGRRTFKIYLTDDEHAALVNDGYETIDLRALRAERKSKRAANESGAIVDAMIATANALYDADDVDLEWVTAHGGNPDDPECYDEDVK